ncbi:MAG: hypothetical protein GY772_31670, partial [bacterium]|nr:hypothetical protein [bacterium]
MAPAQGCGVRARARQWQDRGDGSEQELSGGPHDAEAEGGDGSEQELRGGTRKAEEVAAGGSPDTAGAAATPLVPREPPRGEAAQEGDGGHEGAAACDIRVLQGQTLGPFRVTPKQGQGRAAGPCGDYGGWEATCPFHRKNASSGCRKWFRVQGPTLEDRARAANAAMQWCSVAKDFDRQRWHLAYTPDQMSAPAARSTRALPIFREARPARRVMTDVELDFSAAPETAPARHVAEGRAKAGAKAKAKGSSASSG